MINFDYPIIFQWDKGNKNKNYQKHQVKNFESEEIFYDPNKKILKDILHSGTEKRYIIIGKTKLKRILFIAFTVRKNKIRIISARDINNKERRIIK